LRLNFFDIFYLLISAAAMMHSILTYKNRIVVFRSSYAYIGQMGFGLVMAANFVRYVGFNRFSIAILTIIVIILFIYTVYNIKYIRALSYFNSELETIENIVLEVLDKQDIKYRIDEYQEIVLENSKAKVIITENEVRVKRYKDLQGYEVLWEEIYKSIMERGFTRRSMMPLIGILFGIAAITLILHSRSRAWY